MDKNMEYDNYNRKTIKGDLIIVQRHLDILNVISKYSKFKLSASKLTKKVGCVSTTFNSALHSFWYKDLVTIERKRGYNSIKITDKGKEVLELANKLNMLLF